MDPMEVWRASKAESDLWEPKGKRKVYRMENTTQNRSHITGHINRSRELEGRIRRNSDDSSSMDEDSSRTSSSSRASSSWNSSGASSSSKSSSRSNSSSSSSHSRSRRGQKSKRHVPCIRTLLYGSKEELGYSAAAVGRYENDATTKASEIDHDYRNAAAPAGIGGDHEYRNEVLRGQEGNVFIERKSSWKRLRPRRLVSSIFNLSRSGSGSLSSHEVELILVNVNMHQSPGPIRLVVDRKELVHHVIELALQAYDDQRRQPPLSLSHRRFILYCQSSEFEAMDEDSCIGEYHCRNFYLYPKAGFEKEVDTRTWTKVRRVMSDLCSFKTWFGKSVAEIEYWGLCMLSTLGRNLGYVASSLYCINLDSILGSVVKTRI
ncbi:hypothetical protein R1flu_006280 [Riccia fluitans]|uniref:DUF7054 domain-containing protein n=1 Tax=Riccia fluitans TaxID=41844 RepID=A0ABD1YVK8_9MARC